MKYEVVIGLEIHVQVKTKTKMFTAAPYRYGADPNTLTDAVVLGLPGTLPVLNYEAIERCAQLGLMLGCEIAEVCKWDRKNYFYPDSPKNYQLTQNEQPLCIGGSVEIELPGSARNIEGTHRWVQLNRIHLEEDPGKLSHTAFDSLIDFNRAGVPLAEIVTEPDLYSSEEAVAFLNALRNLITFAGISDCDMEKGQMRCDANVSLRIKGSDVLGTRTEMKNLNSISNVRASIEYEIKRQAKILEAGESVIQETRRWDASKSVSFSLRSKEEAHDYRYFPDPDLLPLEIDLEDINKLKKTIPELPDDRKKRYVDDYNLSNYDASVLTADKSVSDYFDSVIKSDKTLKESSKIVVNWITSELFSLLNEKNIEINNSPITPQHLGKLVKLIQEDIISGKIAKDVLTEMFNTKQDPEKIIEQKGLKQVTDTSEIEIIVDEVLKENQKMVDQYLSGKDKLLGFFVGQSMKKSKGKANPKILNEILKIKLSKKK